MEIVCALCGVDMHSGDTAYGLTRGFLEESCDGFRVDDDTDWEVYCANCMNTIDRLMANYKAKELK